MGSFTTFGAIALGAAAIATATASLAPRPQHRVETLETRAVAVPTVTATISTDWLPAPDARRHLEARTRLLDLLSAAHGSALRVIATDSKLRTRTAGGARLASPLARFERTFEIRLNDASAEPSLRADLADLEVATQGVAIVALRSGPAASHGASLEF